MTSLATVGKGVISERRELYGTAYRDCTYASGMMCCRDAGIKFLMAGDLDGEREALERSDTRPNETGADMGDVILAMNTRYHYSGSPVTSMASAVRTPGYTLLMQGPWRNFPEALRHWQLDGTFNHAVGYRVLTPTSGVVLDPLGPMGYPGDPATPEIMEAFCWGATYTRAFPWRIAMKVSDILPKTVDIAVGKQLFELNGVPKTKTHVAQPDRLSPFVKGIYRGVYITTGGALELLLVKATDCTDIRPLLGALKHNLAVTVDGVVWKAGTI